MKKLMVLVLVAAIVAAGVGCVEKNIESYRITESELLEGVTEDSFVIIERGDPKYSIELKYPMVERMMPIYYSSTRARGSVQFTVMECATKEDAKKLLEKMESEPQFGESYGTKGRVDGQFMIVVVYSPKLEEDALWIFNNAG